MATGTELARPEDLRSAAEAITRKLREGDGRAAETAMALYAPQTQALVVRTAFLDAMSRRLGESQADALRRAGREAERVLDTVPTGTATDVAQRLDHQVLSAMLSAGAGEPSSTVAHLVDPKRIQDLLASDLEIWTEEHLDPDEHPASTGTRRKSINVTHLVHTLWTILQTDDERARAFLGKLNPALVAYPLALELLRPTVVRAPAQEEDDEGDEDDAAAGGDYFGAFRNAVSQGPVALELTDSDLVHLLERIFELSPETYREVVTHAQEMDLDSVREQLAAEADARASGMDEAPVSAAGDEMFAPLDPPKVG